MRAGRGRSGMVDLIDIGIGYDPSGAQALDNDLARIAAQGKRAAEGVFSVTSSSKSASDSAKVFARSLTEVQTSFQKVQKQVDPVIKATRDYNAQQEIVNRALAEGITSAGEAARAYESLRIKFETTTGAITAANAVLKQNELANKSASASASVFESELRRQEAAWNKNALTTEKAARALIGYTGTQKSAEASAGAFEQQILEAASAYDRLEREINPAINALRRFEAEQEIVNNAVRQGVITQQQGNVQLGVVQQRYERAAGAAISSQKGFRAFRGSAQNVAFQVQDLAVQLGAGTSAFVAFGQQLPQLLGAFGTLGAIIGAVVAVAGALIPVLLDLGNESETTAQKVEGFAGEFDVLTLAVEKTGKELFAFERLISNLDAQGDVLALTVLEGQVANVAKNLKELVSGGDLDRTRDFFTELRNLTRSDPNFGRSDNEAFVRQFELLRDASGFDEVQNIISNIVGLTKQYGLESEELTSILAELAKVTLQGVEAETRLKRARDAALKTNTDISSAIALLASEIQNESRELDEQVKLYESGKISLEQLNREKEVLAIQTEIGRNLTAEENALLSNQLLIRDQVTDRIKKETEAREDAIKKVKKLAKEQKKANEKFLKDVNDEFRTTFKDAFDDVGDAFENLLDRFRDRFANLLADLAFEAIARPIIVGLGFGGGSATQGGSVGGVSFSSANGTGNIFGNISQLFSSGQGNLGTQFVNSSIGQSLGLSNTITGGLGPGGGGGNIAGQIAGGTSNLSSTGSFIQNGLNNFGAGSAIAGFGGNLGANLIFGGDRGIGASAGSTIGGAIGTFVGGPIGAFVGSFLGNALGGLVGNNQPPNISATGTAVFRNGQIVNTEGIGVNTDDQALIGSQEDAVRSIGQTILGLGTEAGIKFTEGLGIGLESAGSRDDSSISIGLAGANDAFDRASSATFFSQEYAGSNEQATATLFKQIFDPNSTTAQEIISQGFEDIFEGVSTDVRSVLERASTIIDESNLEDSIAGFADEIQFASDFKEVLDALSAGTKTFGEALDEQVKQQFDVIIESVRVFKENAEDLPNGTARAETALQKFTERFLGIADAETLLTEAQQADLIRNTQIAKATELLEESGFTQDEVNEKIVKYTANLDAQARALETVTQALPVLTDLIGTLQTGQQTSLLSALNDLAEQSRETADDLFGAANTLRQARDDLLLDPTLSTLGPIERLTEAERQFNEVLSAARGGDLNAIERLPDIGRAFLEASREVNASGPGFAEDFNLVRQALDQVADAAEGRGDVLLDQANGLDAASVAIDRFFRTVSDAVQDGVISETESNTIETQLTDANNLIRAALGTSQDGLAGKITLGLTDIRNAIQDGIIDDNELAILRNNLGGAVDAVLAEVNRLIAGLTNPFGVQQAVAVAQNTSDIGDLVQSAINSAPSSINPNGTIQGGSSQQLDTAIAITNAISSGSFGFAEGSSEEFLGGINLANAQLAVSDNNITEQERSSIVSNLANLLNKTGGTSDTATNNLVQTLGQILSQGNANITTLLAEANNQRQQQVQNSTLAAASVD